MDTVKNITSYVCSAIGIALIGVFFYVLNEFFFSLLPGWLVTLFRVI